MNTIPEIEFNKERSYQEIISDTFVFISTFGKQFFLYIFILSAPFYIIGHYFALQLPQVNPQTIEELSQLFNSSEFKWYLFFQTIGEFVAQGIAYAFIISYILHKKIDKQSVISFYLTNFLTIFSAILVSNLLLTLGFFLLIIPGIILFAPLTLYTFDKAYYNDTFKNTIRRCFAYSQTSSQLSYGFIFVATLVVLIGKMIIASIIPTQAHFLISGVLLSALASVSTILIVAFIFLYFTLEKRIIKTNHDSN